MSIPILIGTNMGVLLNTLMPDLALSLLFIAFLAVVGPYLLVKSLSMKKEE